MTNGGTSDGLPADEHPGEPTDDVAGRAMPDPVDAAAYEDLIERHEAELAEQRQSAIAAGKRKAGLAGAAMAGAMMAVAEIYEGPKKDDKPVTVEASSDPDDVDRDGIALAVGDVEVEAPALPALDPVVDRANRSKRPKV